MHNIKINTFAFNQVSLVDIKKSDLNSFNQGKIQWFENVFIQEGPPCCKMNMVRLISCGFVRFSWVNGHAGVPFPLGPFSIDFVL